MSKIVFDRVYQMISYRYEFRPSRLLICMINPYTHSKMKTPIRIFSSMLCVGMGLLSTAQAEIVDLTQTVNGGTYTYYALGDADGDPVTPFTVMFYPGGTNGNLQDTDSEGDRIPGSINAGAPLSFSSGLLTDGQKNLYVGDWTSVVEVSNGTTTTNHNGTFCILFDLGDIYSLNELTITYASTSGQRWKDTANQNVYTATTIAGGMSDFTLQGSNLFLHDTTEADSVYDLDSSGTVEARYVLLELTAAMSAIGDTSSIGGKILEVSIVGDSTPIPEPSTTAVLIGGFALILTVGRKLRRS